MPKKPITSVDYGWCLTDGLNTSWWFQPNWKCYVVKMDHFFKVWMKTKMFQTITYFFVFFCWAEILWIFVGEINFFLGSTLAPFIFVYLYPVTCLGRGSNLAPFIFFYLCAGGICLMDLSWQMIMVTWGCQCSLKWICVLILPILHPCSQASTKWKTMKIASNRWTHKPKMKNYRNFLHMAICDMCDMCYYIRFRFNCTNWRNTRSTPVTLERAPIMTDSGTNLSINEWNGYNQFGWSFAMEREKLWSFCNTLQFDKSSSAQDLFLQNLISWCISASCCWP